MSAHLALLSQLSLWELPPIQNSIEEYTETQIRPVTSFSSNVPIKFYIPSSTNEYVLLNESELFVKVKLQGLFKQGSVPTKETWRYAAPADNFLHSLFKKVNLTINNQEITDDSTNYAYRAYFESLLGWSKDAKETDLSTIIYNSDSSKRAEWVQNYLSEDNTSA